MPTSMITIDDLQEFKKELLEGIKQLLKEQSQGTLKKYLKSGEVMELLDISSGTLKGYRMNGILPFKKIGGNIFYEMEAIQKVLDENPIIHQI